MAIVKTNTSGSDILDSKTREPYPFYMIAYKESDRYDDESSDFQYSGKKTAEEVAEALYYYEQSYSYWDVYILENGEPVKPHRFDKELEAYKAELERLRQEALAKQERANRVRLKQMEVEAEKKERAEFERLKAKYGLQ